MPSVWLCLALLLAVAGLGLWAWSQRQRAMAGLPAGRIVYADTGAWQLCERPMFSQQYRLAGKPDYLVEEHGRVVPVEIKPRRRVNEPYTGDILQLAAYCLLVEEEYGERPGYGYLKYQDTVFQVDYTRGLQQQLLTQLTVMGQQLRASDVAPSHEEPWRCMGCGHRKHCDRRLA